MIMREAMSRTVTMTLILWVGLFGGTRAFADFATPFIEINNKVGDVSEAHGYVVAMGDENSIRFFVVVLNDCMEKVLVDATADKNVVKEALLGRFVIIKAEVVDLTQDPRTKRVLPKLRILSVKSSAKQTASGSRDDSAVKPQVEVLPQTTNGNFVLYVSNQTSAMSPVDITVHIDGKTAVSADFAIGEGKYFLHKWVTHTFQLAPGKHKITAVSHKGGARMEEELEIKDKHWAVLNYHVLENGKSREFRLEIRDKPIQFE